MLEVDNGVSGQIILDSVSPEDIRLSTIHVRYPRMVHSEVMTHRVFTRNGRSSRAVPVKTLLAEDIYTPHFMKNKPGMVASEEFDKCDLPRIEKIWNDLAQYTKEACRKLMEEGVHKQWANRPLEAFGYIDVLISSTDWANFYALRDEGGAQPEIYSIAQVIKHLRNDSKPKLLKPGQWHLPYIGVDDWEVIEEYLFSIGETNPYGVATTDQLIDVARKISTARCARLSIRPFDGDGSLEKELLRYEKLVVSRPVHASPAEHIATPDTYKTMGFHVNGWQNANEHGNYYGWRQFRKIIPDNTIEDR